MNPKSLTDFPEIADNIQNLNYWLPAPILWPHNNLKHNCSRIIMSVRKRKTSNHNLSGKEREPPLKKFCRSSAPSKFDLQTRVRTAAAGCSQGPSECYEPPIKVQREEFGGLHNSPPVIEIKEPSKGKHKAKRNRTPIVQPEPDLREIIEQRKVSYVPCTSQQACEHSLPQMKTHRDKIAGCSQGTSKDYEPPMKVRRQKPPVLYSNLTFKYLPRANAAVVNLRSKGKSIFPPQSKGTARIDIPFSDLHAFLHCLRQWPLMPR